MTAQLSAESPTQNNTMRPRKALEKDQTPAERPEPATSAEPDVESEPRESQDVTYNLRGQGPPVVWVVPASSGATPPPAVAGYEILAELGRGGMGVVYKAWQYSLKRVVALKMILSGCFAGPREVERFRTEARAVARLNHPNLIQIYEIGEQSGLPYYAMEFVDGGSLARRLDGRPVDSRTAAILVEKLARTMHHAHVEGTVHRDLKPANVLLSGGEHLPLEDCVPKITDFGLAKHLNQDSCHTKTGDILGTPGYMAPEQATGHADKVGPATDVYSLGAILYELLTGRVPFEGINGTETLVLVATQDPVAPRRHNRAVPVDLETICLKCLEKEPSRRYASVLHLAEDLQRHVQGETIQARPITVTQRVVKWARRRPGVASLLFALLSIVAISFALVTRFWREAEHRAAAEADAKRAEAGARLEVEKLLAAAVLERGINLAERGDAARGLLWMVRSLQIAERVGAADPLAHDIADVIRLNLGAWSHHVIPKPIRLPHENWVRCAAFSPDGKWLVTGSRDQKVKFWDAEYGKLLQELDHDYPVWTLSLHPSGEYLLTGSGGPDGKLGETRIYRRDAHGKFHLLGKPQTHDTYVALVAFAPDGKRFVVAVSEQAQVWHFTPEAEIACRKIGKPLKHDLELRAVAFRPDGRRVATASMDWSCRQWDVETGKPVGEPMEMKGPAEALAYSPTGKYLLTGSAAAEVGPPPGQRKIIGGEARLWDADTGEPVGPIMAHPGRVKSVAFSPDGSFFATSCYTWDVARKRVGSADVRLWHGPDGPAGDRVALMIDEPIPHRLPVWAMRFSPDSRLLLAGCEDGSARLWHTADLQQVGPSLFHDGNVVAVAFTAKGDRAVTCGSGDGAFACLWTVPRPQALTGIRENFEIQNAVWHPDGKHILVHSKSGQAGLWDAASGRLRRRFAWPGSGKNGFSALACRADGRILAVLKNGELWWLDRDGAAIEKIQQEENCAPDSVQLTPDGRHYLARSGNSKVALLGDTVTRGRLDRLRHEHNVEGIAISATGRVVTCNTWDLGHSSHLEVRDVTTGRIVQSWSAATQWWALALSPDQNTLALGGADRLVTFWDLNTGKQRSTPLLHPHPLRSISFSPSGRLLVTGTGNEPAARLWDVATQKAIGPPMTHRQQVDHLGFHPDGRLLLTAAPSDSRVVIWHVPQPMAGTLEHIRTWVECVTGMTIDGRDMENVLDAAALHERRLRLAALGGTPPAAAP